MLTDYQSEFPGGSVVSFDPSVIGFMRRGAEPFSRVLAPLEREDTMQRPLHLGTFAQPHFSRRRATTVTFVALIHALAIYGLIAALVPEARLHLPPGPIEVINTKEPTKTEHLPTLALVKPTGPAVKRPI